MTTLILLFLFEIVHLEFFSFQNSSMHTQTMGGGGGVLAYISFPSSRLLHWHPSSLSLAPLLACSPSNLEWSAAKFFFPGTLSAADRNAHFLTASSICAFLRDTTPYRPLRSIIHSCLIAYLFPLQSSKFSICYYQHMLQSLTGSHGKYSRDLLFVALVFHQ